MHASLKGDASPGEAPREAADDAAGSPAERADARHRALANEPVGPTAPPSPAGGPSPAAAAAPAPPPPLLGPGSWQAAPARSSAPPLPDVAFTTGAWRERIGWWRSLIVCVVVVLAAAAVVVPSVAVLRHYQQKDASSAAALPDEAAAAQSVAPESGGAQSGPPAATVPPPIVPTTAPPSTAPAPVAPSASPAPTKASGRASAGSLSVAFVVDSAELHAGKPTTVSVSATGDAEDHVSSVAITTADGAVLSSGDANGCEGPGLPWTQTFPVTFASAQSTQIQVKLTSCKGGSLVAMALVDIQP